MDKIKIILPVLIIVVVLGLIYINFSKPRSAETATTILLNKSALTDKYLSDMKFCIEDADCYFLCNTMPPKKCVNRFWGNIHKHEFCPSPDIDVIVLVKDEVCLCNESINQCFDYMP